MSNLLDSIRKQSSSILTISVFVLIGVLVFCVLQPTLVSATVNSSSTNYKHSSTVLHIKFKDSSNITLTGNNFVGQDASTINSVLSQYKVQTKHQLFNDSSANLKNQYNALNNSGHKVADLSQYYSITIPSNEDIQKVSNALSSLPNVDTAYPEPLPPPTPTTPDYTALELFNAAAPTGVSTSYAGTWPGGKGNAVKIVDLEYSWNTNHEDLSKARAAGAVISNGTAVDPYSNNNHGTAVLGIMVGDANTYGVTGIVPNASIGLVNTDSVEGGWSIANAIYTALNHMSSGDVMTIEQQSWGPSSDPNGFVPVEWIPEVYDAISYATSKNITVVEPGGNGSQNLDDTTLYGTTFPSGKADSGAIIVGAGAACSGGSPQRSRLSFSDYGKRVNLQGLGECVITTGYGDFYSATTNSYYTSYFNGTSSATPVVAGAAAAFVSAYKTLNGTAPSVALVRSTLMSTGSAQNYTTGSLTGNIGPLPNLAKALLATDLKAPSAPTNLKASLNTSNKVVLNWSAAIDNVAIASYRVYRNGVLIHTGTTGITYTDTTVATKTSYTYKLKAVDKAGHISAYSNSVTIKTN